jgi:hypothetical protein
MEINFQKIPVMWTTCEKESLFQRNTEFLEMSKNLGLTAERINGPITVPYTIGVAKGYIEMLKKYEPPFLAFEDDARLCPNVKFSNVIKIPDDSDAVYFGTSIFGRIKKQSIPNGVICSEHDDSYVRIFNQLAFHSILYVNKNYVTNCINYLEKWLENPVGGCDDPIAEKMHKHKIYAVNNPWFYQNDGRSENATLFPLKKLCVW